MCVFTFVRPIVEWLLKDTGDTLKVGDGALGVAHGDDGQGDVAQGDIALAHGDVAPGDSLGDAQVGDALLGDTLADGDEAGSPLDWTASGMESLLPLKQDIILLTIMVEA